MSIKALIKDANYTGIQAFPIHENTFVGIASAFDPSDVYVLMQANATTTVTFSFTSGDIVMNMLQGQVLAIDSACNAITSTAEIWIS